MRNLRLPQSLVLARILLFFAACILISAQDSLGLSVTPQAGDPDYSYLIETSPSIANQPDIVNANLAVAEYSLKQGAWERATQHAHFVLVKDKKNRTAHGILGLIAALGGQTETAEQELTFFKGTNEADFYPEMITAVLNGQKRNFTEASKHLKVALQKDSDHPIALFYSGSLELSQGKLDQAEIAFTTTLDRSPDFAPALAGLGNIYWQKQQPDKAVVSYQKAINAEPETLLYHQQLIAIFKATEQKDAETKASIEMLYFIPGVKARYIEQSLELLNQGDYNEAIRLADTLLGKYKKFPAGHYIKAVALINIGKSEAATKSITDLLAAGSGIAKTHHEAAMCYLASGNLRKAEDQFKLAVEIEPGNSRSFVFLPIIEQLLGHRDTALNGFSVMLSQEESPALIHYLRANTYLADGKTYEYNQEMVKGQAMVPGLNFSTIDTAPLSADPIAIAEDRNLMVLLYLNGWYEQSNQRSSSVLKAIPTDPYALWYKGLAQMAQKKHLDATSSFKRLIEVDPNLAAAQMELGQAYSLLNDSSNALASFKNVTKLAPFFAPAYIAMGNMYYKAGRDAEAVQAYRNAIDINPAALQGYQPLTLLLAEKTENHAEAFNLAQKMVQLEPDNPVSLDALGWIYTQQGQVEIGISKLQTAISLLPQEPLVMYHLGIAYYKDNQLEKAKQWLQAALTISTQFRGSSQAETILGEIATTQ
jgi:tetratricopeptide (TPR) repeat protein